MKYLLFVRHNEETFSTFSETKRQGMLAESVQLNGISQDQQGGCERQDTNDELSLSIPQQLVRQRSRSRVESTASIETRKETARCDS